MAAISAYINGVRKVFGEKKLWGFCYGVLLIFGLLMILPIHGMILEHLGFPLDIGRDLGKFDYTQVADLLNNHGEALGIIFYQAKWIFLFYMIVSVILTSGVVAYFQLGKSSFSFSNFMRDALKYFWKFFRLTFYFLLFQLALLVIAVLIYQSILGSFSPFEIVDDHKLVSGFWIVAPIYLLLAFIIQIVSDLAKFKIVNSSSRWIHEAVISSFRTMTKHFFKIVLFFFIHVIAYYLVYKGYHILKVMLSLENNFTFWLLILLGQLFILFRVGLRLVKYAGLNVLRREQRF